MCQSVVKSSKPTAKETYYPCMQKNLAPMYASQLWCNFRKSCMQRLCVAYNFGCRATTYSGQRVLVATRFNVTFLPLRLCCEKTRTCFSKDAENLTTYGYMLLMQSDCLYLSLFFENYNHILLCEWVIELCSACLIDGVSCHNAFAFYLGSTSLGIGALLCSSVVTSVTC